MLNQLEALGFAIQGQLPSYTWSFTTSAEKLFDACPDAPTSKPKSELTSKSKPELTPDKTPDKTPDISTPEPASKPVIDQPITEDKLLGIVQDIAADIHSGKVPTYPLSVVQENDESSPEGISKALILESVTMTRPPRFTGLNDAMFVLDVLEKHYCQQLPAFTAEINRIAQFLRDAA